MGEKNEVIVPFFGGTGFDTFAGAGLFFVTKAGFGDDLAIFVLLAGEELLGALFSSPDFASVLSAVFVVVFFLSIGAKNDLTVLG